MLDVVAEMNMEAYGYARESFSRDEFGLPQISRKSTNEAGDLTSGGTKGLKSILKKLKTAKDKVVSGSASGMKDSNGYQNAEGKMDGSQTKDQPAAIDFRKKSRANVVRAPPTVSNGLKLKFMPLAPGSSTVASSDKVLQKGVDKMKCCIVGNFPRGYIPFRVVDDIANVLWENQALISVSQKDQKSFIFKFISIVDTSFVL